MAGWEEFFRRGGKANKRWSLLLRCGPGQLCVWCGCDVCWLAGWLKPPGPGGEARGGGGGSGRGGLGSLAWTAWVGARWEGESVPLPRQRPPEQQLVYWSIWGSTRLESIPSNKAILRCPIRCDFCKSDWKATAAMRSVVLLHVHQPACSIPALCMQTTVKQ